MIYFATIRSSTEVHAGPLGFTHVFHDFVQAESDADASHIVRSHYERRYNLVLDSITLTAAQRQDPNRYVFAPLCGNEEKDDNR